MGSIVKFEFSKLSSPSNWSFLLWAISDDKMLRPFLRNDAPTLYGLGRIFACAWDKSIESGVRFFFLTAPFCRELLFELSLYCRQGGGLYLLGLEHVLSFDEVERMIDELCCAIIESNR